MNPPTNDELIQRLEELEREGHFCSFPERCLSCEEIQKLKTALGKK